MAKKALKEIEQQEVAEQTPDDIGNLCSQVVAKYAQPNINARTMMLSPQFWRDIVVALRGGEVEGLPGEDDPVLDSLNPESAEVGGADVTVRFIGTGFTTASMIVWNGADEPTTFVSATELTTVVKPSTASGPVDVQVAVRNDQVFSDPLFFSFTEPGITRIADEDADTFIEEGDKKGRRKRS